MSDPEVPLERSGSKVSGSLWCCRFGRFWKESHKDCLWLIRQDEDYFVGPSTCESFMANIYVTHRTQ